MTDTRKVMQQALEALDGCYGHSTKDGVKRARAIQALRSALAQQGEQKPVAGQCSKRECRCKSEDAPNCIWWDEPNDNPREAIIRAWQAGYYHAGYTHDQAYADKMAQEYAGAAPAAQPERQPLTDDEIEDLARGKEGHVAFARAIEAAHGIGADK